MAEYINTIELLGDIAVEDGLVTKTLPEFFYDDTITYINYASFARQTMLKRIVLPAVTETYSYVFLSCPVLETAEFSSVISLGSNSFNQASKFCSLVLRSTTPSSLHGDAFKSTPIASGTGYIYVPKALIDEYKVATNWSTYANQFRALEDYTVDGTITGELDETKI